MDFYEFEHSPQETFWIMHVLNSTKIQSKGIIIFRHFKVKMLHTGLTWVKYQENVEKKCQTKVWQFSFIQKNKTKINSFKLSLQANLNL